MLGILFFIMDINELSINNWIEQEEKSTINKKPLFHKISGVFIGFLENIIEKKEPFNFKGIELTPKLLKNSKFLEFEKYGINGFVNYFELYIIENKFYFFYNEIDDISIENPFKTEIKYLHQLQNLYFLLRNEQLNINCA